MILFCFAMMGLGTGVTISGMIAGDILIMIFGGLMAATFLGGLIATLKKKDQGDRGDPV